MEVKERPLKVSGSWPQIDSKSTQSRLGLGCERSSTFVSDEPTSGRKMKRRLSRGAKRVGDTNNKPVNNLNSFFTSQNDHKDNAFSCGDANDQYEYNPKCCLPIINSGAKSKDSEVTSTSTATTSSSQPAIESRNIDVIVRIRPKNKIEQASKTIVWRTSDTTLLFDPKEKTAEFFFKGKRQILRNNVGMKRPNKNLPFGFDYVYGPENTNQQIFDISLKGLITQVLAGFNCTVFAYGATGSGKTFTMLGSKDIPGITVLMAEELYRRLDEMANEDEFTHDVKVSYLEVYNETIKDLLNPNKELFIREDGKQGLKIPQLTTHKPRGPQELLRLLRSGNSARSQHATDFNSESSRSHAVFEITVLMHRPCPAERFKMKTATSRLFMVDLAGSEKGTFNVLDGVRQREGANINKSLLALSNCINALADGKTHIPFRNSKLTRLLKDSLSGNCVTVMIANVSPAGTTFEDTHNTLHYANRAKNIKVTCKKNTYSEELIEEAANNDKVVELEGEIRFLKHELVEERKMHRKTQEKLKKCRDTVENSVEGFGDGDGFIDSGRFSGAGAGAKSFPSGRSGVGVAASACASVIHDPVAVDRFLELMKQKTELMTTLTQSCVTARVHEWEMNWKKLRVDVADFVGRVDVSDPQFLEIAKLKNCQSDLSFRYPQMVSATEEYKKELRRINQEIENVYKNCLKGLKLDEPFLAVSFEEFIGHKQQEAEIKTLNELHVFYRNFSQTIFEELLSAETQLIHAAKFLKKVENTLSEKDAMTPQLKAEFRRILAPMYGSNEKLEPLAPQGSQRRCSVQEDLKNLQNSVFNPVVKFLQNETLLFGSSSTVLSQNSSEILPTTIASECPTGDTSEKDTYPHGSSLGSFKACQNKNPVQINYSKSDESRRTRTRPTTITTSVNKCEGDGFFRDLPFATATSSESEQSLIFTATSLTTTASDSEQQLCNIKKPNDTTASRSRRKPMNGNENEIEKSIGKVMRQREHHHPVVLHRGNAITDMTKELQAKNQSSSPCGLSGQEVKEKAKEKATLEDNHKDNPPVISLSRKRPPSSNIGNLFSPRSRTHGRRKNVCFVYNDETSTSNLDK